MSRVRARPFWQVDVFTSERFQGNPVAVVLDGTDLDEADMARFTSWTNLSEAAFVLPPTHPDADYRVRIFTSASDTAARSGFELPFAGHPTLGTCHAWLEAGGRPRDSAVIVQQGEAVLVPIRRVEEALSFEAPPLIRGGPVDEEVLSSLASSLHIDRSDIIAATWADNGPGWIALLMQSAAAVVALVPGPVEYDVGVVGPYSDGSSEAFEVRAFFPRNGMTVEDPVTGSLNASLAQWLIGLGRAQAPYTASQGTVLGRSGRVHISRDDQGAIWVGGGTLTCMSGHVSL